MCTTPCNVCVPADLVAPMAVPMPEGHIVAHPGGGAVVPIPGSGGAFTTTAKILTALVALLGTACLLSLLRCAWRWCAVRKLKHAGHLNVKYVTCSAFAALPCSTQWCRSCQLTTQLQTCFV